MSPTRQFVLRACLPTGILAVAFLIAALIGSWAVALVGTVGVVVLELLVDFSNWRGEHLPEASSREKFRAILLLMGVVIPALYGIACLVDPGGITPWLEGNQKWTVLIPYAVLIVLLIIGSVVKEKARDP